MPTRSTMSDQHLFAALPATSSAAVAAGVLDAELAVLVELLVEGGMPLVVASPAADDARQLRDILAARAEASRGSAEVRAATDVAGGVVIADSLAAVLRRVGGSPGADVPDELRGLGLVVVLRRLEGFGARVVSAHYLRPIERDGAGHLQRRPPALLAAWNQPTDTFDHFWWGFTDELAERVGRPLAEFSAEHRRRSDLLARLAARRTD